MRTSRFLLTLIATTAIGLSAVGCDSGSSDGIADTSDISGPNNNNGITERQNLREYMLVGQRGLETFDAEFADGTSAPADAENGVVVEPGDSNTVDAAQLFELFGIADTPLPNVNLGGAGTDAGSDPTVPPSVDPNTTGFHQVYASPGGNFAIGISRAKGRGFAGETQMRAKLQIFSLDVSPLDVTYPPTIAFGPTADPVSIRNFSSEQGEFVSGAWSSNAQQFYASVSGQILVFSFDGTKGSADQVQNVAFPAGSNGVNNAVKLIAAASGQFLYALDNANSQIVTYSRDNADGQLTQIAATPVVSDPRGFTLDRSGKYMYVVGRSSEQVAGYAVQEDGSMEIFDLIPDLALGPIPFNFQAPLGDIATSPVGDKLYLTTYRGLMQSYNIDPATGGLTAVGTASQPLGPTRNSANIEVDPTGRFVLGAFEHDYDSFQSFVTPANGFPINESVVFANTDSATNTAGGAVFSATPNVDSTGRIVYVLPTANPFTGEIQVYRINADGTTRAESTVASENPYGISFFQKVFTPPAGAPATGGTTTTTTP